MPNWCENIIRVSKKDYYEELDKFVVKRESTEHRQEKFELDLNLLMFNSSLFLEEWSGIKIRRFIARFINQFRFKAKVNDPVRYSEVVFAWRKLTTNITSLFSDKLNDEKIAKIDDRISKLVNEINKDTEKLDEKELGTYSSGDPNDYALGALAFLNYVITGSYDWYTFNISNIGVKWNACNTGIVECDDYVEILFDTPWGRISENVLDKMSLLTEHGLYYGYMEPGTEICGEEIWRKGKIEDYEYGDNLMDVLRYEATQYIGQYAICVDNDEEDVYRLEEYDEKEFEESNLKVIELLTPDSTSILQDKFSQMLENAKYKHANRIPVYTRTISYGEAVYTIHYLSREEYMLEYMDNDEKVVIRGSHIAIVNELLNHMIIPKGILYSLVVEQDDKQCYHDTVFKLSTLDNKISEKIKITFSSLYGRLTDIFTKIAHVRDVASVGFYDIDNSLLDGVEATIMSIFDNDMKMVAECLITADATSTKGALYDENPYRVFDMKEPSDRLKNVLKLSDEEVKTILDDKSSSIETDVYNIYLLLNAQQNSSI